MFSTTISSCEALIYHNQISSYEYFCLGKGNGNNFHHSSFKDILIRELEEKNFKDIDFNISWEDASEDKILNIHLEMLGASGINPEATIFCTIPAITRRGTFLFRRENHIIERAFILNLIPSPGLYFTKEGAYVRPYPAGYWIKFYKTIPAKVGKKLMKDGPDDITRDAGCVELKIKHHFLTPVFLHLLGTEDEEIVNIYKFPGETLEKIKELYIYDNGSLKKELKNEIISLLDPKNKRNLEQEEDEEILEQFRKEFLQDFPLDKTGRWQIKRRFKKYNIDSEEDKGNLTGDDIKNILRIIVSGHPESDDRDCLSNNMVLLIGDYLEEIVLKSFKKFKRTLDKELKDTPDFKDFTGLLQDKFVPSLERSLGKLFTSSTLSQVLPGTNMLYDVTYQKKITRCGPGGIGKERAEKFESRDIHPSYYGRICPMDTPQSDKIGLVLSLTENTRVNDLGILETPYLKVNPGGEVRDEVVWMTPDEEKGFYIAFGDQKDGKYIRNQAFAHGRKELVKKEETDYIDYSVMQGFSLTPQLIPFLFCNDPARILVAVSLLKQALPLKEKELPLIYTGMEQKVGEMSGQLVFEDMEELTSLKTSILGVLRGREKIKGEVEVSGKKLLSEPPASKNGSFAPGVNLLCAYVPWKGYNFEDAIVLSESASRRLTSRHFEDKVEITVRNSMILKKNNPFYSEEELAFIGEDGIIETGTAVKPGDLLVSAVEKNENFKVWMKGFSLSPFGDKACGYEDVSCKVPEGVSGKIKRIDRHKNSIEFDISDERLLRMGDKIANRYGGKGVVSLILPDKDMPFFMDGKKEKHIDIILNPLGVISRMNLGQIMETHLGLCAKKAGGRFMASAAGEMSFEGDKYEEEINEILKSKEDIRKKIKGVMHLLSLKDKVKLRDPLNNNIPLDNPVVVGYQYFMKLIQQAEEKFYFRSTGDYGLITEQPLKGKKRDGGQRVGEMEGWAFQSHRAFNLLEEMFTVKSDDLKARESLSTDQRGTPESIKAFVYYMRGLSLDIIFSDGKEDVTDKILSDECTTSDIKTVSLKIAGEDKIMAWSGGEVLRGASDTIQDMTEEEKGLYSYAIFGDWSKDGKDIRTKMGHIKLPCSVPYPLCKGKELTLLPVIPFAYRPVMESYGKVIKYPLNSHYEIILSLKRQIENYDSAQEKRQKKRKKPKEKLIEELRRSVNDLFTGKNNKFKSFITLLEKKEGHFRKNMLGKRVDYSGRGVIAVDPELNIDQVCIPVEELAGKRLILNRQPSLHRLSVAAFENIFSPGDDDYRSKSKVIFLNPLVTGGFGADFDGDTMAVHLPLGEKALEDTEKMFPSDNFLSPANGKIHFNLGQDVKLGIAYASGKKELRAELLQLMALEKEDLTPDDFESFIKELLSGKKDHLFTGDIKQERLKRLKEILHKIFHCATMSGTTFSIFDLPSGKELEELAEDKKIELHKDLCGNNTLFMLYPAKARGNEKQLLQLCHKKGEVARIREIKPEDEVKEDEVKIDSYYLKGLTSGEYFYSNYGSIKTHVDKKLGTGHGGELARHLIEVAYDYVITEEDCKTEEGIKFTPGDHDEYVTGRYPLDVSVKDGPLDKEALEGMKKAGKEFLLLRSPITCKSKKGICKKCYGLDLSAGKLPEIGTPVGILAAQSIGERGTQLQMKTVHTGGAKNVIDQDIKEAQKLFYSPGDYTLETLLSRARNIYPKNSVKDVHFELIFKSMLEEGDKPRGLKSIVLSQGLLKSLSFGKPLSNLTKSLGSEDKIEGLKKNLLFMINPDRKGADENV